MNARFMTYTIVLMMLMILMRWEHQRLSMQKEDLEEKWREIQQTKLSKENQRALGESSQVIVAVKAN